MLSHELIRNELLAVLVTVVQLGEPWQHDFIVLAMQGDEFTPDLYDLSEVLRVAEPDEELELEIAVEDALDSAYEMVLSHFGSFLNHPPGYIPPPICQGQVDLIKLHDRLMTQARELAVRFRRMAGWN